MKQFIYTKNYDIINVDLIIYIFINSLVPNHHEITARVSAVDGFCTINIQDFSDEDKAKKAMDEIMVALAQGQSYSIREVDGYNAW